MNDHGLSGAKHCEQDNLTVYKLTFECISGLTQISFSAWFCSSVDATMFVWTNTCLSALINKHMLNKKQDRKLDLSIVCVCVCACCKCLCTCILTTQLFLYLEWSGGGGGGVVQWTQPAVCIQDALCLRTATCKGKTSIQIFYWSTIH